MTVARALLVRFAKVLALVAVAACEKREPPPGSKPDIKIETTYEHFAAQLGEAGASAQNEGAQNEGAQPQGASQHVIVDREMYLEAGALAPRVLTHTVVTQNAVDPDKLVIDDAHMRAARCFDGYVFDRRPRSATIDVTVIPTGRVTRAEVRSMDTTEPQVLACLRSLGESLVFSERMKTGGDSGDTSGGLRTYAIDVAVVPAH